MILGVNMIIDINNHKINYVQYGKGKDIILLHGWGQNIQMMDPLGKQFSSQFRITILDFPGFGESEEPKEEWTIYDYVNIVEEFIKRLKIVNPIVIGHSFGGRVGIGLSSRNQISKLVLFGSPCVRKEQKLSVKVKFFKFMKKVPIINKLEDFVKNRVGSTDYRSASIMMRKILVNVINEDLSDCAKKISCPTLLIWGENDTEAPLEEAKELDSLISDSGLIVLPNSTHYAYLENLNHVTNILNEFFRGE